ncbi:MAG: UbiA-like polyprenyltransferase [Candidatus Zixiibacteriota bacterium]
MKPAEPATAVTAQTEVAEKRPVNAARRLCSLIKFEHTVFSLPFVALGALLGAGGLPDLSDIFLILLALISARTAAMSFNRIVDRRIDRENPRTAKRELPSGSLSVLQAATLTGIAAGTFIAAAFLLRPLCGWLSLPALVLILGYSYSKRFTEFSHFILGLALGISPGAAWLAVGAPVTLTPILLGLIVVLWVAGFDILYSLADTEFDRKRGLHSIPQRFGPRKAIGVSRVCHALCATAMIYLYAHLSFPLWSLVTLAPTLALFVRQHTLVKSDDLSRLDAAFFTLNGWIGILFSAAVATISFSL